MHNGQNRKNPKNELKLEYIYDTGDGVFPKNENSTGLVEITLEGRYKPHKNDKANPLKIKIASPDLLTDLLTISVYLRNLKTNLILLFKNGRNAIKIEKPSKITFLYNAPLLKKKKNDIRKSNAHIII